jgi:hypothetical protein
VQVTSPTRQRWSEALRLVRSNTVIDLAQSSYVPSIVEEKNSYPRPFWILVFKDKLAGTQRLEGDDMNKLAKSLSDETSSVTTILVLKENMNPVLKATYIYLPA